MILTTTNINYDTSIGSTMLSVIVTITITINVNNYK